MEGELGTVGSVVVVVTSGDVVLEVVVDVDVVVVDVVVVVVVVSVVVV